MVITAKTPGIKKGNDGRYTYNKDLQPRDGLKVDLDGTLYVRGVVNVIGDITCQYGLHATKTISATGSIEVSNGSIQTDGKIHAREDIRVEQSVVAEQDIEAERIIVGGRITSAYGKVLVNISIFAKGYINAYNDIIATRGCIQAGNYITSRQGGIYACEEILARREVSAGGDIEVQQGNFNAKGPVVAGKNIKVNGRLHSKMGIESGGRIEANSINTEWGIKANETITVQGEIYAGTRIFAGLNLAHDEKVAKKTIQCAKIKGHIGYGTLVLTKGQQV